MMHVLRPAGSVSLVLVIWFSVSSVSTISCRIDQTENSFGSVNENSTKTNRSCRFRFSFG